MSIRSLITNVLLRWCGFVTLVFTFLTVMVLVTRMSSTDHLEFEPGDLFPHEPTTTNQSLCRLHGHRGPIPDDFTPTTDSYRNSKRYTVKTLSVLFILQLRFTGTTSLRLSIYNFIFVEGKGFVLLLETKRVGRNIRGDHIGQWSYLPFWSTIITRLISYQRHRTFYWSC